MEEQRRFEIRDIAAYAEAALRPLLERVQLVLAEQFEEDPFQRDSESVARGWALMKAINVYFDSEVRGWENVPKGEAVLFVGNHSGGVTTFDPVPVLAKWMEAWGCETPIYALTYDFLFAIPRIGQLLRSIGCLPASHHNAERALQKGASVIVFPGGDQEVFRSWRQRNQIRFGGRLGFVELAIRNGVRVIPMTIHGAHESTFVLTRGERMASTLGLDRLKIKVFPIHWHLPLGPVPAFIPSIPLPSKVTVELGRPLDWSHHSPEAADDPEILQACYAEITGIMQETLDRLSRETPHPVFTRLNDLRPSRIARKLANQLFG